MIEAPAAAPVPAAAAAPKSDPLAVVAGQITGLWKKFVGWVDGTALPALQADEKKVVALFEPILNAGEAAAVQDLRMAITGVLSQVKPGQDLPTLEGIVLTALQLVDAELFALAKGMGSNALQALIGLILAKLA